MMLSGNDPHPFDIINKAGNAPLLIACDHAENRIPDSLSQLGLADEDMEKHIAYDIGAKAVSVLLSEMFDAPLIMAGYSRLVIDLNRHLDDPSLVIDCSDNIEIPGNRNLNKEAVDQRIKSFFNPYHDQYAILAKQLAGKHKNPFILSIHSFTPVFNGDHRPWEYGVLWDHPHRNLAQMLMAHFSKINGLTIGDNQPYHANDPLGYAQVIHAEKNSIEMALIEIRQDLISNRQGQVQAANILYKVLSPILNAGIMSA